MLKFVVFVLAVICCPLLFSPRACAADSLDAIDRAMGLVQSNDSEAARTILAGVQAQTDNADNRLVSCAQGVVAIYTGDTRGAETIFRATLDKDPRQLTALWGVSLCLLARQHVFEATVYLDRAANVAPANTHIKALQSYAYLMLGRLTDAAAAGKTAMDGGEKSPFLMATLAQIYRQMGYAHKALEFGSFAAKSFYGMNFLVKDPHICLPLTMTVADSAQVLQQDPVESPSPSTAHPQRTNLELEVPATDPLRVQKALSIVLPPPNSTVCAMQSIRATYTGVRQIKFVIFLADQVMRGMTTEIPYQFEWDADAAEPGEHQLCVRAFDVHGALIAEDAITVTSAAGKAQVIADTPADVQEMQNRLLEMTMPDPQPLSLFVNLGWWYHDLHETGLAIAAFEKAAAIDPTVEGVLPMLAQLYTENGLHALSPTGEIYHGAVTGSKLVALTFDDGPNPLYTQSILSELKKYDAHSTFFLVGKMARLYPDLVLQILADGHELGNHSYTHPNLTKLTSDQIIAEVLRNRSVLKDITGKQTYLFRPPGGDIDQHVIDQIRALDYNIIYWSINTGDYRKHPPQEQAQMIADRVKDGSIILMHDGVIDGTLNILPTVLDELNKRGFTFVTVSELMSTKALPGATTETGATPEAPMKRPTVED